MREISEETLTEYRNYPELPQICKPLRQTAGPEQYPDTNESSCQRGTGPTGKSISS